MERGNSTSISVSDRSFRRKHSVDRISELPDSILCHILSFLSTKKAVATGILSQRWKFLWTTIRCLDFYCCPSEVDRFVDFVNHVLLLHKPEYLDSFRLSCVGASFYFNIWITAAITRNVCELILMFYGVFQPSFHVQRSMFSCDSLRYLQLGHEICIPHEIEFSLPKLERLELFIVIFGSEETLCNLLGGCPMLKYLFISIDILKTKEKCHLDNGIPFKCVISSTSLRHLHLYIDGKVPRCYVQLDAPSLEYIELRHISSMSVRKSLISLVEANIHIVGQYEDQGQEKSMVEAFCAFDRAKKLVLNYGVIKAFICAPIEMKPIFNELTRLEVTRDLICWIELHHFLQWLGNLEVFIVDKERGNCHDEVEIGPAKPDIVPRCLSNSLRSVAIVTYCDDEDDIVMISYLLKHASVLKHMAILVSCYDLGKVKESELIQTISKLPRKSPVCEVDFTKDAWLRISRS